MTGYDGHQTWEEEDYSARQHMINSPDHEVIVGTDDRWHCLTCEADEDG